MEPQYTYNTVIDHEDQFCELGKATKVGVITSASIKVTTSSEKHQVFVP